MGATPKVYRWCIGWSEKRDPALMRNELIEKAEVEKREDEVEGDGR